MSDEESTVDKPNLIDIAPFIQRKIREHCDHPQVEIDDDCQEITCLVCDRDVDPWWYLRKLAVEPENFYREHLAREQRFAQQIAQHNAWVATANETIARINAELNALTATKNRLWNERVDGQPLGSLVHRRRRKKA